MICDRGPSGNYSLCFMRSKRCFAVPWPSDQAGKWSAAKVQDNLFCQYLRLKLICHELTRLKPLTGKGTQLNLLSLARTLRHEWSQIIRWLTPFSYVLPGTVFLFPNHNSRKACVEPRGLKQVTALDFRILPPSCLALSCWWVGNVTVCGQVQDSGQTAENVYCTHCCRRFSFELNQGGQIQAFFTFIINDYQLPFCKSRHSEQRSKCHWSKCVTWLNILQLKMGDIYT